MKTDFLVIGSGAAGLSFALKAAAHGHVTIVTKGEIEECNTNYAQGGICSTVVTYTNLSGKLESTPEQPTMTGYIFDGWYTEPVGGSKVTTSTVFTSDATIYAHWIAKAGASTVPQPATQPAAIQWQKYVGPALVAGALLTTLLVSTMF